VIFTLLGYVCNQKRRKNSGVVQVLIWPRFLANFKLMDLAQFSRSVHETLTYLTQFSLKIANLAALYCQKIWGTPYTDVVGPVDLLGG
jgi:hypothetical protein